MFSEEPMRNAGPATVVAVLRTVVHQWVRPTVDADGQGGEEGSADDEFYNGCAMKMRVTAHTAYVVSPDKPR